jgi:gliding motility-associated-like protein
MNHLLDSILTMITPEMPAQCARWGVPFATWQANVQVMRDFIDARCITTQQGMVDCYDLTGPFDVVYKVNPPLSGEIKVNSVVLPNYPFQGVYYGQINTGLEAIAAAGWTFDHWEATNHVIAPSMTDSIGSLTFTMSDTIIAHFKPPVSLDIVLMTDPEDKAIIEFNGLPYADFPVTVGVAEAVPIPISVTPNEFYDFLYWEVKHNIPNTNDSTQRSMEITFYTGDTIMAHLRPQEYGYWAPNAFTPNGDLINDVWQPWGNVIELESFEMQVFDRWGQLMWEAKDPRKGWDGTNGDEVVPPGVYAFRGKAIEAISKEKHDLVGHVSVIR